MKIVEISASLGHGLKRYNSLEKVSISKQPFRIRLSVLYGITKGIDIVQTNAPTNILIDVDGNPIGNSQPVYFGIRVYPFISERQNVSCENNILSYGQLFGLYQENWFSNMKDFVGKTLLPDPYTGDLYPQPIFVESLPNNATSSANYQQAMQQFINDCVFPTKPNIDLPGQSQSGGGYDFARNIIPYFSPEVYQTPEINHKDPRGVLCLMQDTYESEPTEYKKYMVQFDGQKLNFKFGMAVNSDFARDFTETPNIYLPYLYRTYVALVNRNPDQGVCMGVVMQCLLYDNLGNVITG